METSSELTPPEAVRPGFRAAARALPVFRWACLGALLLTEFIGLTLRFDLASLPSTAEWSGPLRQSPKLFRLGSLIVIMVIFLNRTRLPRLLTEAAADNRRRSWWPALVVHLLAFVAFATLSARTIEGDALSSAGALFWVLAWLTAGGLMVISWAAAVLPWALWVELLRRGLLGGVIVGGIAWGATVLARDLWRPLSRYTFWCVERLLRAISSEVVSQPEELVVGTPAFRVEIARFCSGIEGIGLVSGFVIVYLWVARKDLRFPRALCILPIGIVLIWFANVLRITTLVAIGTWGWPAVAMGGFHSQVGWLTFIAVSLGLVAGTQRLSFFRTAPAAAHSNPATPYLLPLVAILATGMITGALSSDLDWFYPARVLVGGVALWFARASFLELKWRWSWSAVFMGWVVFWMWLIVDQYHVHPDSDKRLAASLAELPRGWVVLWLVFRVFGSVVTVPLAEELAFRGYVNRRLIAAEFERVPYGKLSALSFLVSSVLFGVLHDRWFAGTIAGMLYALILARRGRFSDAVLAHATTNALLAIYVLLTGEWSLWL